jgi:hypothetical protein
MDDRWLSWRLDAHYSSLGCKLFLLFIDHLYSYYLCGSYVSATSLEVERRSLVNTHNLLVKQDGNDKYYFGFAEHLQNMG